MKTRLLATLLATLGATAALAVTAFASWPVQPSKGVLQPAKNKSAAAAKAEAPGRDIVPTFLKTYCFECHGAKKPKGDRRFDQLILPASNADDLALLQDALDQLNLGDMPPKKAKQPSAEQLKAAIDELTRSVADGQTRINTTRGQTVLRRLNRREYLNTVGDLFALNMTMFDPTEKFPGDQVVMHMDNIGDALRTSSYLLDQYLDAADQVVEKAFKLKERPAEQTWTFNGNFRQQDQLDRVQLEGKPDRFRYLNIFETPKSFKHNGAYAPLLAFADGVPADGYYEIKVKAEAMHRKHAFDPALFSPMDFDEPFRLGVVPGNKKAGWLHYPQPIEPLLAETALGDNGPEWHTFKVWLDAGYTPRFTFPNGTMSLFNAVQRLANRYSNQLPKGKFESRAAAYEASPHIRIHEVSIRGPLYDRWPPAGQQVIFGGKPFEASRTREILTAFAGRAYRRPARPEEIDRLVAMVEKRVKDGKSPLEALKDGFKAVLCSPAFLYLAEPAPASETTTPHQLLSAYALATRLSYYLCSTTPDAELTALAHSGELLKPDVLIAQTRRLRASPKSDAFVEGFLDSWLNLRSLGDMPPPEGSVFDNYYAHDLQSAMRRETQLFTRHLLDHNESIVRFLDADYTFVNRPLAKLYGMPDAVDPVEGQKFRRVKLTNPNRGGLLGQASVLTVSANGVETSPVTRGIWILENILGVTPPPPPDNVPPIDPDVRGAKSMPRDSDEASAKSRLLRVSSED